MCYTCGRGESTRTRWNYLGRSFVHRVVARLALNFILKRPFLLVPRFHRLLDHNDTAENAIAPFEHRSI